MVPKNLFLSNLNLWAHRFYTPRYCFVSKTIGAEPYPIELRSKAL